MPDDVGEELQRFRGFMDRAPGDEANPPPSTNPDSYPLMRDDIPSLFEYPFILIGILVFGVLPLVIGTLIYFRGS
jgi:hypothetical protein